MGKFVRRKGSKTVWEIWFEDDISVSVMNYNSYRPMSRIVKREIFDKNWEIVKHSEGDLWC